MYVYVCVCVCVCVCGTGGNELEGTFEGDSYNLHAVWDSAMIDKHVSDDFNGTVLCCAVLCCHCAVVCAVLCCHCAGVRCGAVRTLVCRVRTRVHPTPHCCTASSHRSASQRIASHRISSQLSSSRVCCIHPAAVVTYGRDLLFCLMIRYLLCTCVYIYVRVHLRLCVLR